MHIRKLTVTAVIALAALAGGLVAAPAQAHPLPGLPLGGGYGARECATPSIDRLQHWLASGEGASVPATGSLLVPVRGHRKDYAAKVELLNAEWHVLVVWLDNQFEGQADLSRSAGFWLTYSATEDLYVQLRPAFKWSGGDQWLTTVPSTRGRQVTRFFSLRPEAWTSLPELGAPPHTFAATLPAARGLVFVGKTANRLDFRGLRFHNYTPTCR